MQFLSDGKRFIWASERTGYRNYYLYDLSGKLLATLTNHPFEVGPIELVDEKAGVLWYMARSGDNHMKLQLHRVGLDGKGDRRLTDPAFHHTVMVAPDGRHFVDVAQTHDTPPVTRLMDANGKVVAELAKSDMTKFEQLGLQRVELFTFTAADGVTELHGMLHRPSNFDPNREWPLLVSVYAGPATNGARETFMLPDPLTEFGFLVVTLDARSAGGRGKRFLDAIYEKLGQVEIDDLAAGVKALRERPYVDGDRVGIFGTSYGGYASAMALVRYPDVFHAASASSPVTDWRHYDTIYTERYMWTPQGNRAGYDAGSVMTYVDQLRGRLMIYYGTADNNVHPSNAMQLIAALQRAGKSFEVQVGPDRGHTAINRDRMMEFFIESLILEGAGAAAATP
jgi:dipeptidyl-peptidase-4